MAETTRKAPAFPTKTVECPNCSAPVSVPAQDGSTEAQPCPKCAFLIPAEGKPGTEPPGILTKVFNVAVKSEKAALPSFFGWTFVIVGLCITVFLVFSYLAMSARGPFAGMVVKWVEEAAARKQQQLRVNPSQPSDAPSAEASAGEGFGAPTPETQVIGGSDTTTP